MAAKRARQRFIAILGTLVLLLGMLGPASAASPGAVFTASAATSSARVTATIPVGLSPIGVAVNPTTKRIYAIDANNKLAVVDETTDAVIATVPFTVDTSSCGDGSCSPIWSLTAVAVDPVLNKIIVVGQANGFGDIFCAYEGYCVGYPYL